MVRLFVFDEVLAFRPGWPQAHHPFLCLYVLGYHSQSLPKAVTQTLDILPNRKSPKMIPFSGVMKDSKE